MQYGFKARFVIPIELGTKQQTIRAPRKGTSRHARRGDLLQLSTGDRFHPRRIGLARCISSRLVQLQFTAATVCIHGAGEDARYVFGHGHLDDFAREDGFQDWPDLKKFWRETHGDLAEFNGCIITWGDTFAGPLDPPPADLAG